MNGAMHLWLEGIGVWAPDLPDWAAFDARVHDRSAHRNAPARPAASLLPPAERRRAPDTVRLAVEVAAQAVAMSGRDAAQLPSVFTSAHGDAMIMDYMCATLAQAPLELSPTRFHNSVHNAAAGYWTIATGCRRASSAVCAGRASFGAGLLEAATQCVSDHAAILLSAFDAPGSGPLADVISTRMPLACALVLSPERSTRTCASLHLRLEYGDDPGSLPNAPTLRKLAQANTCGNAVALLEILALNRGGCVRMTAGNDLLLHVDVDGIE